MFITPRSFKGQDGYWRSPYVYNISLLSTGNSDVRHLHVWIWILAVALPRIKLVSLIFSFMQSCV